MNITSSPRRSASGTIILLTTIIPAAALFCLPGGAQLAIGWLILLAALLWLRNRPTGDEGALVIPQLDPNKPSAEKDAADFYPLAMSYTQGFSEQDREDAIQELILKVFKSLPRYNPSMPLMSYVRAAMKFRKADMHEMFHNQGKGEKAMNYCTLISQLPDYQVRSTDQHERGKFDESPFEEWAADTKTQPCSHEPILEFLRGITDERTRSVFCTLAEDSGIEGVETVAYKPMSLHAARSIAVSLRKSKTALDFAELVTGVRRA